MKILIFIVFCVKLEIHQLDIEKFKEMYTKDFNRELISTT